MAKMTSYRWLKGAIELCLCKIQKPEIQQTHSHAHTRMKRFRFIDILFDLFCKKSLRFPMNCVSSVCCFRYVILFPSNTYAMKLKSKINLNNIFFCYRSHSSRIYAVYKCFTLININIRANIVEKTSMTTHKLLSAKEIYI